MKNKVFHNIIVATATALLILGILSAITSAIWVTITFNVGMILWVIFTYTGFVLGWNQ